MRNTWSFSGPTTDATKIRDPASRARNRVALISFPRYVTFFLLSRRLTLSLGLGHSAQFSFAHRLIHALGRAF